MSEPNWLTPDEAKRINELVVERSNEPHFIRDQGLLESALARPMNLHAYGEGDLFQLAASYAEGVSRNHAFEQGNKRTAFACADMFLSQNGHELQQAKGLEHVEMMEQLGQGKITREQAAEHLREHSRPLERERSQDRPKEQVKDAEQDKTRARKERRIERKNQEKQKKREQGQERDL
ncbi:type II toxin-antitoxin system death-on-curing family toxin [Meridianimarinicoccus aquatilis]|uniref:Type II toxin-antitoxin system death-on-curing family toxin n=1 Tax=Meridianimarinicoccus aquatilis TaxID=2552766 RepID=A0A4R6A7T3_9RHOB|nr:type II toxin-antitoxin system death-on-curing family toxin [Fluviibacterium aquatile]TDL79750.1 type II toxin-antitoxin system death-on-curing family toxin [Fluviibacterium aquatile]